MREMGYSWPLRNGHPLGAGRWLAFLPCGAQHEMGPPPLVPCRSWLSFPSNPAPLPPARPLLIPSTKLARLLSLSLSPQSWLHCQETPQHPASLTHSLQAFLEAQPCLPHCFLRSFPAFPHTLLLCVSQALGSSSSLGAEVPGTPTPACQEPRMLLVVTEGCGTGSPSNTAPSSLSWVQQAPC